MRDEEAEGEGGRGAGAVFLEDDEEDDDDDDDGLSVEKIPKSKPSSTTGRPFKRKDRATTQSSRRTDEATRKEVLVVVELVAYFLLFISIFSYEQRRFYRKNVILYSYFIDFILYKLD